MLLRPAILLLVLAPLPAASGQQARPRKELVINYGGGGWKEGQVQEPCILINPKDPKKLIMIFAGAAPGGGSGSIGKAWADLADPFTWHEDPANPILKPDPAIPFESDSIRLDCVLYQSERDEYWIYYTGHGKKSGDDSIGLATCSTGKDGYGDVTPANLKRHPGNPILAGGSPGREDEKSVSQGAVFREGDLWYSFYSYRTASRTLPGIRLATSVDGMRWKRESGPDLLSAAPESKYYEWHQVYKIDGRYVMTLEAYNGGTRWRANVATSSELTRGWTKAPVDLIDQTRWPGYSDDSQFHVATPAIYALNGKWYLYVQAARSGFYSSQRWAMYALEFDEDMKKILARPGEK